MIPCKFHPEADAELEDAALFYESRMAGLGKSFAAEVERTMSLELLERLAALVPPPRRPLVAYRGLLAPRAEWRSAIVPTPAADEARAAADPRSPRRWPWARLLYHVFRFDVLVCDRCGGPRRILGAVTEPDGVRRLLVVLGLAAEPPPGRAVPAA